MQQIDETRERALLTAKLEKERRLRERKNRWICGNVLSEEVIKEDDLQSSLLLSNLKASAAFTTAAAMPVAPAVAAALAVSRAHPEADSEGHSHGSMRPAQEAGAGSEGNAQGQGTSVRAAGVARYKTALADLLLLEKNLVQWYGRRCDALLEEVGKRLVEKFDAASGTVQGGVWHGCNESMLGALRRLEHPSRMQARKA